MDKVTRGTLKLPTNNGDTPTFAVFQASRTNSQSSAFQSLHRKVLSETRPYFSARELVFDRYSINNAVEGQLQKRGLSLRPFCKKTLRLYVIYL